MMLFLVFQNKSRKTIIYQKLNYKCTFIVLNEYRYTRFLSFCLFFNFFLSLEIRLNSVVQSKQSVDQTRPLPLGALRQLPHFASRSYATGLLRRFANAFQFLKNVFVHVLKSAFNRRAQTMTSMREKASSPAGVTQIQHVMSSILDAEPAATSPSTRFKPTTASSIDYLLQYMPTDNL